MKSLSLCARHIAVALMLLTLVSATYARGHSDTEIAILGDSNIWIGGDDCRGEKAWPKWFIDEFQPAGCRSYARSGATWSHTADARLDLRKYSELLDDDNVIICQAARLVEDVGMGKRPQPDIIIIAAGGNDAWFKKRRPGLFSQSVDEVFGIEGNICEGRLPSDVLSLPGAIRYNCDFLREIFPEAMIVLITPSRSNRCSEADQKKVADIIEECGRRLCAKVIRLDEGERIYAPDAKTKSAMTTDGVHTSPEGARLIGRYIAGQLDTMLADGQKNDSY